MAAFDIDVLYVNQKLLDQTGTDISALDSLDAIRALDEINAVPDLFGSYEGFASSPSALADFRAGNSLFCAAHASDAEAVFSALPGYCRAIAIPGGSIEAEITDLWHISGEATENQRHAAELFLSYLAGNEAQDILCLQNRHGLPANSDIYELYRSYHPELSDILVRQDSFDFD